MTPLPRVGALSERVQLQRRETTTEPEGGHLSLFVPVISLWARVASVGARPAETADGRAVAMTHTVVIRHRAGIKPGDRFVWKGRALDILGSEDISGQRRFLACRCTETAVR